MTDPDNSKDMDLEFDLQPDVSSAESSSAPEGQGHGVQGPWVWLYAGALALMRPASESWQPRALLASAQTGEGIDEAWQAILEHRERLEANGELALRRREQARSWMWSLIDESLLRALREHPAIGVRLPALEKEVQGLQTTPAAAARELLAIFRETATSA